MVKLREIKSKSDDTTTKARQYLDGLLKIPFGTYSREKVLDEMAKVKEIYLQLCKRDVKCAINDDDIKNEKITALEIKNTCIKINNQMDEIGVKYLNNFINAINNRSYCDNSSNKSSCCCNSNNTK